MKQITILSLLLILSLTQDNHVSEERSSSKNYHIRRIYYNLRDNVCHGEREYMRRDVFKVQIQLPDKLINGGIVVTGTDCDFWSLIDFEAITVDDQLIHTWNRRSRDERDEMIFKQEMHRTFVGTLGLGITVKTTIDPDHPAIIQGVPYDCQVQGDDKIHHFGYKNDIQPPTVQVTCNKKLNLIKK